MPTHYKVFIVSNSLSPSAKNLVAQNYTTIFNGPPWFEDWTQESSLNVLEETINKEGFAIAYSKDGFCMGYEIPKNSSSSVDYQKISRELRLKNINPVTAFYLADVGIVPNQQGKRKGPKLLEALLNKTDSQTMCMRTKNDAMIKAANSVLGDYIYSFPEESAYEGGRVFVYQK